MINITKKEIDGGAIYKMKVYRNGKCTWEYGIKVTGGNIDGQQRDRIAQFNLYKEFNEDCDTDDLYELFNLIPLTIEETNNDRTRN